LRGLATGLGLRYFIPQVATREIPSARISQIFGGFATFGDVRA